jgi:hypothetical protein
MLIFNTKPLAPKPEAQIPSFPPKINQHRAETCELIIGIDILFDDVKTKVVQAAERPDRKQEQEYSLPREVLCEQAYNGGNTDNEKERGFEKHQARVFEIAHADKVSTSTSLHGLYARQDMKIVLS